MMEQSPLPPLPVFDDTTRDKARTAIALSVKWYTHNQITQAWPNWTADAGRFPQLLDLNDTDQPVSLSLCWSTARAAQALLSAYRVLGDDAILPVVTRAMAYVKSCQLFAPEFPQHAGACAEETGQSDHLASRDTVEALQAFINAYAVTRDPVYLKRAVAAADWWSGWFLENGYPNGYIWHQHENDRGSVHNDFSRIMLGAVSLAFSQLDAIRGQTHYTRVIPRLLDHVIDDLIRPDGAFMLTDGTPVGHHAIQSGPFKNCFVNDDGFMIACIAAYRATGNPKYRDAAVRNAAWWLAGPSITEPYAAVPSVLLNLLDFYRLTGDTAFLAKSAEYIDQVLALQITDTDAPRFHGGFRGHDVSSEREAAHHPSPPLDQLSLRTTMYATLALAKVTASSNDQWNMAYSAFGW